MAHLRSYKSFNLEEIEEIESRIFCPVVAADNILKGCPGSTNIPNILYESSLGSLYKRQFGEEKDAKSWEIVKNNIISVLHHAKHADPMVVHLNERYIEHDDLDFYDDISVCGVIDGQDFKEFTWAKKFSDVKVPVGNVATTSKTVDPLPLPAPITERDSTFGDICSRMLNVCFCRNRKE